MIGINSEQILLAERGGAARETPLFPPSPRSVYEKELNMNVYDSFLRLWESPAVGKASCVKV